MAHTYYVTRAAYLLARIRRLSPDLYRPGGWRVDRMAQIHAQRGRSRGRS